MAKDPKKPRNPRSRGAVRGSVSPTISEPAAVDSVPAEIAMSSVPSAEPKAHAIGEVAAEVAHTEPAIVIAKRLVEPIAEAVATAFTAAAAAQQPNAEPSLSEQTPAVPSPPPDPPQMPFEPQAVAASAPESEAKVEPVPSTPDAVTPAVDASVLSYEAAVMGMAEINAKAVSALHANSVATLTFFETLMGARSLSEAIRLQTEHARKQFETVSGQAKELTALARRVAQEAASGRKR